MSYRTRGPFTGAERKIFKVIGIISLIFAGISFLFAFLSLVGWFMYGGSFHIVGIVMGETLSSPHLWA
ncbi:MAG: hypothetical protein K6A35_01605 [bacterium]|nr:hypothetical protein [bacterium]